MNQAYKILDEIVSEEDVGIDGIGIDDVGFFDWISPIIDLATSGAKFGVSEYQQHEAANTEDRDTKASIAADVAWAQTQSELEAAKVLNDQKRIAKASDRASTAASNANTAGAKLTPNGKSKRSDAALAASNKARADALANPNDTTKAMLMKAWANILPSITGAPATATTSSTPSASPPGTTSPRTPSTLKRTETGKPGGKSSPSGGIPTIALVGGGVAITALIVFLMMRNR